ncbi:MAG: FAD:protein FMN transferase [Pirellulales bacterium]
MSTIEANRARVTPSSIERWQRASWFGAWLGAWLWGTYLGLSGFAWADSPAAELVRYESTQPQMGVPFKIILYASDEAAAKGAFEAAFSHIAALNRMLSDYDPQSELSRLSRTAGSGRDVPVSETLWNVLARSQALAGETDGAFDVTVGPYVRLWRRARRNKEMPASERLAQARSAVGYQLLKLDEQRRTARLQKPGMLLDLGGIAMGYAVDEALELLRKRGMTRALIDASGDIGVSDPPPGKRGWTIDVAPLAAGGAPGVSILLANAAVTTSGDAFQHVVIGGKRYSHIIDPRTGLGLTDQSSVTVIAADCTTADSLATAVSVLGPKAGLKLIERTQGTAALIIRAADGKPEVYQSAGFSKFVVSDDK